MLRIANDLKMGRGVFVSAWLIGEGTLVEVSPIIIIPNKNLNSVLIPYVYEWTKTKSALALGVGSLFNHSDDPNVEYTFNKKSNTIEFITLKPVVLGEQLFIDYGYDPTEAE